MNIKIEKVFHTSCKSLKLQSVDHAKFSRTGLEGEHEYLLIEDNSEGKFVGLMKHPVLSSIKMNSPAKLGTVTVATMSEDKVITLHKEPIHPTVRQVKIYDTVVSEALDQGDVAANFFSYILNMRVRLVQMSERHDRLSDDGRPIAFHDRNQFLVVSRESHEEIERQVGSKFPIEVWRPTLVVSGFNEPFQEDTLKKIDINGTILHGQKACQRCAVIERHPETGERLGLDINKTLEKIRSKAPEGKQNIFGWLMGHDGNPYVDTDTCYVSGVSPGDALKVIE